MDIRKCRNKEELFNFFSGNPGLYLYLIGDLDDFFWPDTTWYAVYNNEKIISAALFYNGPFPTLILFYDREREIAEWLLKSIRPELPGSFNVHLGTGLIDQFGKSNIIRDYGRNYRMVLEELKPSRPDKNIRRLGVSDLIPAEDLYRISYPFNWFDRRMLETGRYFGYFSDGVLAGISGIHVFSSQYRIAALGNIAVHPSYRGRKIATLLTSTLCRDLQNDTDIIGLNVSIDNTPALKCYQNCGFKILSTYDECLVRNF
jgi:GNAT superfamily N-acetyltransferase